MRTLLLSLLLAANAARPAAAQLRASLARLQPDTPAPTIVGLDALGDHRTLPAPGGGRPCGLAWCQDTLWLLRGDELLRIDRDTGAAAESLPAEGWIALTADRRFVYAATEAGEVVVIDPLAGRAVRTIPPAVDLPAPIRGIAVLDDNMLLADDDGRVLRLDADRTKAELFWRHPGWDRPTWICADAGNLVFARGGLVHWIHPGGGDVLRTSGAPERTLAAAPHGDELWMLRSLATSDEFFVVTPRREIDSMDVRLVGVGGPGIGRPGAKPGEIRHWLVGKARANTGAELGDVLRRARTTLRTTETVDGGRTAMPFVLTIHPGVTVAELLTTLDAATEAGIELQTPGLARWAETMATAAAAEPANR